MNQALAIFRKDVRRLWPALAGVLALTAFAGYMDRPDARSAIVGLVYLLLAGCWFCICAFLIQQESLPGDRQYWVTRPYDWRLLLAAKILFVTLFALLPLIAVQTAVLWAAGTPPWQHVPAVVSRSLGWMGATVLAAGALAAVTRSLMQLLWGLLALVGLAAIALSLGVDFGGGWGALNGIRPLTVEISVAAVGMTILLLQYRFRSTGLCRAILPPAVLLIVAAPLVIAWRGPSMTSAAQPASAPVNLEFDGAVRRRIRFTDARLFPEFGREGFYLPIRTSQIPADTAVLSEQISATIEAPDGRRRISGWLPAAVVIAAVPLSDIDLLQGEGPAWLYFELDRASYEAVKSTPVRMSVAVGLELLQRDPAGEIQGLNRKTRVAGDGICRASEMPALVSNLPVAQGLRYAEASCAWPQPGPQRVYAKAISPSGSEDSGGLMISEAGLFVNGQSVWHRKQVLLEMREPRFTIESWRISQHLERALEINRVILSDFAVPRGTNPE